VDPQGPENAHSARHFGGFGEGSPAPWLVFGGGGLKGLAHIGVLQALEEAGVSPAGIVGTSIGALVGACAASGMSIADMRARALELERKDIARLNRGAVWINGIREESVFRGDTLREYFAATLPGEGWAALRMPLLINVVDLADGSTQWLGTGARQDVSLVDAVYASSALPMFYPPFQTPGHAFVDGGILETLPVGRAQEEGAVRIVAVDVGSGGETDAAQLVGQGMIAIQQRVLSVMMWHRRHEVVSSWTGVPLLYVRPRLDGYGTFDFEHVEYFLEEGYRAMREALGAS
jgi:NTE family protein